MLVILRRRGVIAAVPLRPSRPRAGIKPPAERPHHRRRAGRRRPDARRRQLLADRADDQPAHQPRIAEAHIGLGRMHIHIHQPRLKIDEQSRHRMTVPRHHIGIGGADGGGDQLVAHRPSVDIGELAQANSPG